VLRNHACLGKCLNSVGQKKRKNGELGHILAEGETACRQSARPHATGFKRKMGVVECNREKRRRKPGREMRGGGHH